ncbi:hypothetical protein [Micromonospora sp. NPDC048839]|uniref:hypothetical protein n=1 Tax=Micromonospora sp. NPDC048839 TaxID=3155641 RepID=UPI0033EA4F4B
MILLTAFSIISWLLGTTTAVVAGMGACTLADDEIRRYLGVAVDQELRPQSSRRPRIPGGMTNEREDRPIQEAA